MRTLLNCLFLLLPLSGIAKSAALPPPVVPQCFGIGTHLSALSAHFLDGLQSVGVGWIQTDLVRQDIEKTPGVYDFSATDALANGLTKRHLRPMFVLLDADGARAKQPPAPTPETRAAFARFAAAAAAHFQGKGVLWEIEAVPGGAVWTLAAAHAIHAADPDALVVGLIPSAVAEALFRQGLLLGLDAVAFRPTSADTPEADAADDLALRLLIHRYAPPGKDIPLVWEGPGPEVKVAGIFADGAGPRQAESLTRGWLAGLADGVRLCLWDGGADADGFVDTADLAFVAAHTLTHTLGGYRFIKRVPLASPDDYLLLFASEQGPARLAAWTSGAAHDLLLPIPRVSAMTGMTGDALTPVYAQDRLRLPLSGSPVFIAVADDAALREAAAWSAHPAGPFYGQAQPLQWEVTYRNPDRVTHRVRFQALMMTAGGGRTPISGGTDNVGPGQTLRLGMASSAMARAPVQIRVGLSVDAVLQPYPQDLSFTPTDPVTMAISVPSLGTIRVDIANPSGEPFTGTLSNAGASPAAPLPIHIAASQTALSLTLAATHNFVWRLTDAKGRLVAIAPGVASQRP